ncbi:mitochondrial protein translocase family [Plasmopara halstedii]|uniref:Mitochondrial protein translocase family n=1 Tax=Plasmopara halstedii TaxID=4781 RepID=A0A0P1AKD9_PLAHL|nr:mitochondrial protein translocase family [Plasmopara halstedii]CEG41582.1 mitochondrial protein translocase family [Plasmopara halstedii]|eukprot:XP_024577951.1 mitochondrial protein translocase family [Plasmopara halstedii]
MSNSSWNTDDRWQDSNSSTSGSGFDSSSTNGLEWPVLPTIPSGSIDIGAIAPVFGVSTYDDDADYLDYDKAGRPFMEQMSGSCGTAYFSGIIGGGAYGAVRGFTRSPSTKFKIRMNSIMNGAATRGSKAGNALGCLAMIYKAFEYVADSAEIENIVKFDQVTPILASAATGVFYKSTAGPKTMILAGAIGAGLMTVVQFGIKPFYPRL